MSNQIRKQRFHFMIYLLIWINIFMDGYAVLGNIGKNPSKTPNNSSNGKPRNLANFLSNRNHFGNEKPIGNGHNSNTGPFYCGPLIGQHYMVGSQNFCGGLNVNDCSALCFVQNYTYFQCEGNICHCFQ